MKPLYLCVVLAAAFLSHLSPFASAQGGSIDFNDDRWELKDASLATYLDRECLTGSAFLEGVEFENGVIEVDMAVSGSRSYPGFIFRMRSEEEYESIYIRPHRAGLYPDAVQYTPVFNGQSCWQLYSGRGYSAGAVFPENQWFHLKVEVNGSQARVFVDAADEPALVIHDLKLGSGKGKIGIKGPQDGTAFFSNFRYTIDGTLEFEAPPRLETAPGTITDWEVSRGFPAGKVDGEQYPQFYLRFYSRWQKAACEPSGLVNVSRLVERSGRDPDIVFARTVVSSESRKRVKLSFGYSDAICLFLNGKLLFSGNSAYRSRDPSFVGIVGPNDAVHLDLRKGLNEIFLAVTESFGGWGFLARADRPLDAIATEHERARKVWETTPAFLTPESVLHDPRRDILYVSSLDNQFESKKEPSGFISRLKLDGEIEERKWITGLRAPCGMALLDDKLYVVERGALVEIDIDAGKIAAKYPVPSSTFLNDIIAGPDGSLYISDSFPAVPGKTAAIYRFKNGKVEVWLDTDEVSRVNGLFVHEDSLLFGNSEDCSLKSIRFDDRRITTIAHLGVGIVDGIRIDGKGRFIVSLWEGQTFLISPDGRIEEILDTLPEGRNIADFEYIGEKNLLIIPTFLANKVVAYEIDEK